MNFFCVKYDDIIIFVRAESVINLNESHNMYCSEFRATYYYTF